MGGSFGANNRMNWEFIEELVRTINSTSVPWRGFLIVHDSRVQTSYIDVSYLPSGGSPQRPYRDEKKGLNQVDTEKLDHTHGEHCTERCENPVFIRYYRRRKALQKHGRLVKRQASVNEENSTARGRFIRAARHRVELLGAKGKSRKG